jgi:hypothetical protein
MEATDEGFAAFTEQDSGTPGFASPALTTAFVPLATF